MRHLIRDTRALIHDRLKHKPSVTAIMSKPGAHGTDLEELASYLLAGGPKKVEATNRRVRVRHNGATIVDTLDAVYVWEHGAYPQFYVRPGDLEGGATYREITRIDSGGHKAAAVAEMMVPGRDDDGVPEAKTDRVLVFADDEVAGKLAGLMRLEFGSMDQWLEEDKPIYVHPKDPYKRIELLPSSRPVEIKLGGRTVARSAHSTHLLETGLRTRYYMPLTAVDQTVLRTSELTTHCPYKGEANYYDVVVAGKEYRNIIWYYRLPTAETAAIADMVCFYNEKVETYLDGKLV